MGDEVGGRSTEGHRATESRGRRTDPSPSDIAKQFAREMEPTQEEREKWLTPAPPREAPDVHLQFFKDLLAISGSSAAAPLSAGQAAAIKKRWGIDAPYAIDPAAREAALLGFEIVLTIASFVPVPPIAAAANAALIVMALVRGENGLSIAASAIPFNRIKAGERALRALLKLGRVFRPKSMKEYQRIAGQLLTRDKFLWPAIKNQIQQVTSAREKQAVEAAMKVYKAEKLATGDAQRAAQLAGDAFHKTMRAAGSGKGADRVLKGTKELWEIKSHYVPIIDEVVLLGGRKQVVGYVLKEIAESSVWYKGRVLHVFINPATGEAVRLVIEPLHEEKLVEALLRLSKK